MPYRLGAFHDPALDDESVARIIDEHRRERLPRLNRFWGYFRNPETGASPASGRPRQAQESGLPARLVPPRGKRREVVIENDIAWRIQTMIDFMFGRPVLIASTARDQRRRELIGKVLDRVWERSGGIALLQDTALLGHVFGHVDLLLRPAPGFGHRGPSDGEDLARALAAAEELAIEPVEPRRGVPVLSTRDYRDLRAFIIHHDPEAAPDAPASLLRAMNPFRRAPRPGTHTEIIAPHLWQIYEDDRLIAQRPGFTGGELPVAHIQNFSQPFAYDGLGEVEPLIGLQDELNTRLSDRACRVTMQSFKMYLARGVEGFASSPIGPGCVWSTDNPEAQITEFGGDAHSPSEESHIQELREAFDKVSGVPPLAGGVVRARIGNLSSANALRITLMSLLSRTARKRVTYGRGIARVCELVLAALDHAGVLKTDAAERAVRLEWPDPLPQDLRELIYAAEAKARLGVPRERVLEELGYSANDPGVQ